MPPKAKSPGPPPKEAIEFFEQKGLQPGFDYTDVWKEEHSAAFTIAKVTEINVLAYMRGVVQRALEEGTTFRDFVATVEDIMDKSGWSDYNQTRSKKSRLRIIYETNLRVARAAGQWQRIERTKQFMPFLRYELGPSVNHREEHVAWAGTTLPVDDPWWDDHATPNGYGCACNIRQMGTREVERGGGVTARPPSYDVEWEHPKTGRIERVPVGIQPGWNHNPGKDRFAGVRRAEKEAGL